jgi:hypothetical protein
MDETHRTERLHLRIPQALKERMQAYAKRNHTTLSALVTRFFNTLLQAEEEKRNPTDADQV